MDGLPLPDVFGIVALVCVRSVKVSTVRSAWETITILVSYTGRISLHCEKSSPLCNLSYGPYFQNCDILFALYIAVEA